MALKQPDGLRRILIEHTVAFAIMQTMVWIGLAYAIRNHQSRVWLFFCANVALPPLYIWATYKSMQTAWRGLPRDEVGDVSLPAVVIMLLCGGLYVLLAY